ncbi:KGK domain-containing protein [Brunnivagina elsteri]|uniref:KGK domain-containing protein n=1 Tax=Brunnivagina elsteri CCALA 953 TaxID=987040 RepID=A0A2A2TLL5_9CYAN|nr:KGK domain-containing protein [Calothrix elsteri]PAX58375.1 hypothetical protein CK510_07850 [Calothrix elsteri CCALA 953]
MELRDNDVISMDAGKSLTSSPTFQVEEALARLKSRFFYNGFPQVESFYFSDEGVRCKMLRANGSGWRKGKIRFRLEFIPDEKDEIEVQVTTVKQSLLPASPLDDLRENLNIE